MRWLPGTLVVFEGLDRTGKSTQVRRLTELPWPQPPATAHMPRGLNDATRDIYKVTEARKGDDPAAMQLLHLAAHVLNMQDLVRVRASQGLVMDRCEWSPLAYGRLGEGMESAGITPELFVKLVQGIWARLQPDVVFLFVQPFEDDAANTSGVEATYRLLAERAGDRCVELLLDDPDAVHRQVITELQARGIVVD